MTTKRTSSLREVQAAQDRVLDASGFMDKVAVGITMHGDGYSVAVRSWYELSDAERKELTEAAQPFDVEFVVTGPITAR